MVNIVSDASGVKGDCTPEADKLAKYLTSKYIGRNIYLYDSVTSTNKTAAESESAADGSVFAARRQSGGRGRRGRTWESGDGGLWFSILLKPSFVPNDISALTLIAGMAVCEAIRGEAKIKWPNDVVIGGRKVCGILTELSAADGRINHIICGIGINLSMEAFSKELTDRATSLKLCGISFNVNELLAAVLNKFEMYYEEFLKSGFSPFVKKYMEMCVNVGRDVSFTYKNERLTAPAVGVSENGALIVSLNGIPTEISSGEVTLSSYGKDI